MDETELSIVIPLFNERENIPILYKELNRILDDIGKTFEIIFVDDGGTDDTFEFLKSLSKKDKNVSVIKFRRNFGQTAALKAGFNKATAPIIISIDGDLQNDPADIPKLLKKLDEGYDLVSGWRHNRKDSMSKKIPSKISNWMREKLLGDGLHDSGCTLRVYRKETLENLQLYGEMHRYIASFVRARGYRVGETKVVHRERKFGTTKYSSSRMAKGFLDLLYVKFWSDYSTRPLHVFGSLGLLQIFSALLIFLEQMVKAVLIGGLWIGPLLLLSVLLLITGTLFILFGFLCEIQIRTYYEKIKEVPYEIEVILR
jgi:glycosyltransferase involved in cell wall biosynthesis|tara:strand:- start:1639 stop:2580 length:942 start_codon:yes stop_codon:yes gene_type:complete